MSIDYCLLPIFAYCPSPVAHRILPIAYCLLPTAHRILPIACCLLPIPYCLLVILPDGADLKAMVYLALTGTLTAVHSASCTARVCLKEKKRKQYYNFDPVSVFRTNFDFWVSAIHLPDLVVWAGFRSWHSKDICELSMSPFFTFRFVLQK